MLDKEVFNKVIMDRVNELREKHGFSEHTPYTRLLVNSLAVYMLDEIENFNESDPNYTWNKEVLIPLVIRVIQSQLNDIVWFDDLFNEVLIPLVIRVIQSLGHDKDLKDLMKKS